LDVESPYPIPTRETLKAKPARLAYPKRYPRYSHLGKNLEVVINKALKEENPDKRLGFANAVAYYMKLAYNNWHKELVHDDAIRQELSAITEGQLDFTNTPYVKAYREDTRSNNGGSRNKNFRQRNNGGGEETTGATLAGITATIAVVVAVETATAGTTSSRSATKSPKISSTPVATLRRGFIFAH
jgi:hypothetical protein